jgi:Flp pilus assembly secretin CpaC
MARLRTKNMKIIRTSNHHMRAILFLTAMLVAAAWNADLVAEEDATEAPSPVDTVESIITKEKTIETRVGEKRRVRFDAKVLDVAVTRPEVADAFVSASQEMMLSANSPGVGRVIVQLDNGEKVAFKVRVFVADPEEFVDELKKKIGHIQGIDIEVVKGKILVDGRVLYLEDMDAIERTIGDNPSIINLTSLSSRNARILAREIQRELRESGIYGARVEVRNNRVTLVGSLASKLLVKKAEHIASTYTPTFDSLLEVAPHGVDKKPTRQN